MKKAIMLLLIILFITPALPVSAATREISVYLYRDYPDCVFFVSWENADKTANIQIKSPDGTITNANSQNTAYSRGGAVVSVGNAASGYWTVSVTGENLGGVSVSGGNQNTAAVQNNAIQKFEADISGGDINFKWNVATKENEINILITAAQGESSRTVWNDYSAQKNGRTSVSVDEFQTGLYRFTLQVYDGFAQYALTTDEPLYVTQSNAPEKLENVRVGSIDGEMYATWSPRADSSYFVTLYDYESFSTIRTDYIDSNYSPITLPDSVDRVRFSVAAIENNVYGEFDVYEMVQSIPTGNIAFPDSSVTRESAVRIRIDCLNNVTAGVYLDETLLLEDEGAGDYDLMLSEGTHEVLAYLKDANGNMKTFSKTITVDKTPPILNLNLADGEKTASDSIVIGGNTEPGAVVTINGVEQELGAGGFMARFALENGVNQISVSAYDSAGNKSVQTVTVERTGSFGGGWVIFILPCLVFVLLTVWYIYLNRKGKRAKTT